MASEHWDLDQDNTLGGNSPSPKIVSSQKAVKEYVDNNGGGSVDQEYDGTSTNAQSGVAISGELTKYVKSANLATVATSGNYNDLSNKPTIPTAITITYGV